MISPAQIAQFPRSTPAITACVAEVSASDAFADVLALLTAAPTSLPPAASPEPQAGTLTAADRAVLDQADLVQDTPAQPQVTHHRQPAQPKSAGPMVLAFADALLALPPDAEVPPVAPDPDAPPPAFGTTTGDSPPVPSSPVVMPDQFLPAIATVKAELPAPTAPAFPSPQSAQALGVGPDAGHPGLQINPHQDAPPVARTRAPLAAQPDRARPEAVFQTGRSASVAESASPAGPANRALATPLPKSFARVAASLEAAPPVSDKVVGPSPPLSPDRPQRPVSAQPLAAQPADLSADTPTYSEARTTPAASALAPALEPAAPIAEPAKRQVSATLASSGTENAAPLQPRPTVPTQSVPARSEAQSPVGSVLPQAPVSTDVQTDAPKVRTLPPDPSLHPIETRSDTLVSDRPRTAAGGDLALPRIPDPSREAVPVLLRLSYPSAPMPAPAALATAKDAPIPTDAPVEALDFDPLLSAARAFGPAVPVLAAQPRASTALSILTPSQAFSRFQTMLDHAVVEGRLPAGPTQAGSPDLGAAVVPLLDAADGVPAQTAVQASAALSARPGQTLASALETNSPASPATTPRPDDRPHRDEAPVLRPPRAPAEAVLTRQSGRSPDNLNPPRALLQSGEIAQPQAARRQPPLANPQPFQALHPAPSRRLADALPKSDALSPANSPANAPPPEKVPAAPVRPMSTSPAPKLAGPGSVVPESGKLISIAALMPEPVKPEAAGIGPVSGEPASTDRPAEAAPISVEPASALPNAFRPVSARSPSVEPMLFRYPGAGLVAEAPAPATPNQIRPLFANPPLVRPLATDPVEASLAAGKLADTKSANARPITARSPSAGLSPAEVFVAVEPVARLATAAPLKTDPARPEPAKAEPATADPLMAAPSKVAVATAASSPPTASSITNAPMAALAFDAGQRPQIEVPRPALSAPERPLRWLGPEAAPSRPEGKVALAPRGKAEPPSLVTGKTPATADRRDPLRADDKMAPPEAMTAGPVAAPVTPASGPVPVQAHPPTPAASAPHGPPAAEHGHHSLPKDFSTNLAHSVAGSGQSRAELILEPAELGRLRFDLVTQGDQVQVILAAERPETLDLLRRHADELRQEFKASGLDTGTLSFGQWGKGGDDRALPQQPGAKTIPDDLPLLSPSPLPSPRRPASASGLDLRL